MKVNQGMLSALAITPRTTVYLINFSRVLHIDCSTVTRATAQDSFQKCTINPFGKYSLTHHYNSKKSIWA